MLCAYGVYIDRVASAHSLLSPFSGMRSRLFFVEFDGKGSRSKFKQEHGQSVENGQKIASDEYAAGIFSLVPGVKNLRLQNGHEFDRA